ncbi:MAG: MotA/TolQ/ExbB proton channel family protein [Myxococcota bacterium]
MIALLALAFADPGPLDAAYQREYAYLQAEIEALNTQRRGLADEQARRISEGERALSAAQAEVLDLTARRTALEDALSELERGVETSREGVDRVESTLVRATSSLPDLVLPEGSDPETQARALQLAVVAADQALVAGQTATVTPGTWFRLDGTRADGDILRYGNIAAFAIGDGALAPAGEGRLVRVEGEGTYLFEGEAKRATPEAEKTWADQLRAGGLVGAVILMLGAVGVLLSLARMLSLALAARGRREVRLLLEGLSTQGPDAVFERARRTRGAAARIVEAMLDGTVDPAGFEDRASEAILRQTPRIERFGAAILVIAAVSPLLGLLGTVTGMIGTFEVLTTFGTGDPRMLSGGISEALVTTQLGLIVAIPMLLVGNLLDRAAENLLGTLESTALGVINRWSDTSDPGDQHRMAAK